MPFHKMSQNIVKTTRHLFSKNNILNLENLRRIAVSINDRKNSKINYKNDKKAIKQV